MKLPILLPHLPTQRFDCHGCTNCCRELVVHLTPIDREKIDRQAWAGKIDGPPYVRLQGGYVLNHRPGGGCVFLNDDGTCRIHSEFGGTEKPLACQLYPFTLEAEAGGLRAGVRFDCPTVARSAGSGWAAHRSELSRLGEHLRTQMPKQFTASAKAVRLKAGRSLSATELDALIERLDRWVGDAERPLDERLAGMASLVESLSEAKLDRIRDGHFAELVGLLVGDLPSAVQALADLPPPSERQWTLLRQAVFSHSEHITLAQARASMVPGLLYRWNQMRRARRLARGDGAIPDLAGRCSPAGLNVRAVEAMHPQGEFDAKSADELITRYIRVRLLSRTAFGPAYYDWAVLDGLAALLLAVCAAGWLGRYFAAVDGRSAFDMKDVGRAVGIVDRTAGRARELGASSARLRIAFLRRDQGLLRLLRAQPIIGPEHP